MPAKDRSKNSKKAILTACLGSLAISSSTALLAEEVIPPDYPVAPMETVEEVQPLEADTPDYINPYASETTITEETTQGDSGSVPVFIDQGSATAAPMVSTPQGVVDERDAPAGYYAQIGAFSNVSNALRLSQKNRPSIVVSSETNGKLLYRVQVGPFDSWDKAFAVKNPTGGKTIYVQH